MARAKTARQVAASRRNIKKAQIASARKRRGTGKGRKRKTLKQLYQRGHSGPGAHYRRTRDYWNSTGVYSRRFGGLGGKRKVGKVHRAYRKATVAYSLTTPVNAAILGISYHRDRKRRGRRR